MCSNNNHYANHITNLSFKKPFYRKCAQTILPLYKINNNIQQFKSFYQQNVLKITTINKTYCTFKNHFVFKIKSTFNNLNRFNHKMCSNNNH